MKRKVIVIGGGIAGLSAGIYAQKCGFETTILESHGIAGGNCTSWKRGGYLFEGGMHWLAGSNPNEEINALWRYVGALDDSVKIRCDEPFMEFDHEGTPVRFYRDVNETERHLSQLSPADAKEIKKLCDNIRKVDKLAMPVSDLPRVKYVKADGVTPAKPKKMPLSMLFVALSVLRLIKSFASVSRDEYANRFTHPGIREAIRSAIYEKVGVAPFLFTLGSIARGDGGFPEGGSLPFAQRMVDTFTKSGGKILLNTRADRVLIENAKAVAVMAKGEKLSADSVIITADTMQIDHLFETPPKSKWLDEMKASCEPTMVTLLCLGVNADLSKFNRFFIFKLKTPIKLANQTYEYLSVSNYADDPVYSPAGKSALTIQLPGDTYDFWKKAKEAGTYADEKKKIGEAVISALAAKIPEIDGQVEICDVATPLTYERYCANWKGSWMTEMTREMKMKSYPALMKGLSGVYFAGQRMLPPGGLPSALMSARAAVQCLCRDTGAAFVCEG